MNFYLTDRSALTKAAFRENAEPKVRQTFSRFEDLIAEVSVVLVDENGPKGGLDKTCRLSVVLRYPSRVVRVKETAETVEQCLATALHRAERGVKKLVGRPRHRAGLPH